MRKIGRTEGIGDDVQDRISFQSRVLACQCGGSYAFD